MELAWIFFGPRGPRTDACIDQLMFQLLPQLDCPYAWDTHLASTSAARLRRQSPASCLLLLFTQAATAVSAAGSIACLSA